MTITIQSDEYEIESETVWEAVQAMIAVESAEGVPTAELPGEGELTLEDLSEAWRRKSSSSNYNNHARAAYCDAAEKLDTFLNNGVLTESP